MFRCEKCNKEIWVGPDREYTQGCEHYNPENLFKPCPFCGDKIIFSFEIGYDWTCDGCDAHEDKIMKYKKIN